jgi:transposase-like protein
MGAKQATSVEIDRIRSKRWTESDARMVVAAVEASGLTIGAFAKQHALDHQRLRWWIQRFAAKREPAASPSFVPVVVRPERDDGSVALVVRLAPQPSLEIRMPERVSPAWLAAVLRELGEGWS